MSADRREGEPDRRAPANAKQFNHYFKDVKHLEFIDVYRVTELWNVTDPCLQHALKKLLVSGGRTAGKSKEQDVREVIASCQRWLEMQSENEDKPLPLGPRLEQHVVINLRSDEPPLPVGDASPLPGG